MGGAPIKTMMKAHRIAYELAYGAIPDGVLVCHRCDVPACVNPSHLFIGTHVENMSDCVAKGRTAKGEKHGLSKLTEKEVIEIRSCSGSQRMIAKQFGVSQTLVGYIRRREYWKHV